MTFVLFLVSYLFPREIRWAHLAPIVSGDAQLTVAQRYQLLSLVPEPSIAFIAPLVYGLIARRRRSR